METINVPDINEDERAYYREVWGFDPTVALSVPEGTGTMYYKYRYEAEVPFPNDLSFGKAGVQILARVDTDKTGRAHNSIVFRRETVEGVVRCTHTVAYTGSADEVAQLIEKPTSLATSWRSMQENPRRDAILPPWGHFVALRSFVAGLAEIGIVRILTAYYLPSREEREQETINIFPFGFNPEMQSQVIRALWRVAPATADAITWDIVAELMDNHPPAWWDANVELIQRVFDVRRLACKSLPLFRLVNHALKSWAFRKEVALNPLTVQEVLEVLAKDPDQGISTLARARLPTINNNIEVQGSPGSPRKSYIAGSARFNGKRLNAAEARAMASLEQACHTSLLPREDFSGDTLGFAAFKQTVTMLGLSGCDLRDLPRHIADLTGLFFLTLDNNALKSLPDVFSADHHLLDLYCNKNQLQDLPQSIGKLANLSCLKAEHNLLVDLPREIADLLQLKSLYLDHNCFQNVPSSVLHLHNLQTLWLFNNALTVLPPKLGNLTSLSHLLLSNNQIRELPDTIGNLNGLEQLYLDHNALEFLPANIGRLQNLRILFLNANPLRSLPPEILELPHLHELHVEANLWDSDVMLRQYYDRGHTLYVHNSDLEEIEIKHDLNSRMLKPK